MSEKQTTHDSATHDLKTALQHAAKLLGREPAMAEAQAQEILKRFSGDPDAMQLLGTAQRLQGRPDEALQVLKSVVKREPDFARAAQELGLTYATLGDTGRAIRTLRKAVQLQPKLAGAWKALGDLLAGEGDEVGSRKAYQRHLEHSVNDPLLVSAANYLYEGRLANAEHLLRPYLKKHPTDVSAIRLLAATGMRLGQFEDAGNLLERCLELAPDFRYARSNYAYVLFKRTKYAQALDELDKLLQAEPDNPNYMVLKSSVLVRIGEFQAALDAYENVLSRYPNHALVQMSYGHTLKTVGRFDDAIAAYRASIELQPTLGEAYWSLANLKTFRFEDAEIADMVRQAESYQPVADDIPNNAVIPDDDEEAPVVPGLDENSAKRASNKDYFHLCFSLGKALEDQQDYDKAFDYYQRGNESKRQSVHYDADENHDDVQAAIALFDEEFFAERADCGCPSLEPIFIVGLPRSGSTLLEQILASHSQVEGTMELPDIIAMTRRLGGRERREDENRYPGVLAELSGEQLAELGEEYLERTRIQRSGAAFFTDKMPNNFLHVGFIRLILPNAKIIDARRHPLACCFSGYKQLFARGQTYTYDLADIGRYYRDYVGLMDHWDNVLPDTVLKVHYEDVVGDIEGQVRQILDYCKLPFETQCLEFQNTERAVRTASSEQVRQPLYADAVEYWRHFDRHLTPLVDALGPTLGAASARTE
ncbi:MAG: tetratricopeptide repeat protein [Gammaproteobacteria bacterium]|nr:MAG: tetratricopeptide repeat protein [Gammaproteobacteria bacterium]